MGDNWGQWEQRGQWEEGAVTGRFGQWEEGVWRVEQMESGSVGGEWCSERRVVQWEEGEAVGPVVNLLHPPNSPTIHSKRVGYYDLKVLHY